MKIMSNWNKPDNDDETAALSHTTDKATAGVNLAVAGSAAQTESALAGKDDLAVAREFGAGLCMRIREKT